MQILSSCLSCRPSHMTRKSCGLLTLAGVIFFSCLAGLAFAEPASRPLTGVPDSTVKATEKVVLAGGCFWGVQAVFQHTKGVLSAISGYAGGTVPDPSYEQVSSGRTGHAESVEVTFDPKQISFDHLLKIYFSVAHDPTELNRQGPDEGTQYRSEIFTTSTAQQSAALAHIAELQKSGSFSGQIVTTVEPLQAFYRAEPYHQDYATLHPSSLYIMVYDRPKITNLKKHYPDLYREEPVLVGNNNR
jgi:peptide-methionine (S)-S-oxide reductase